MISKQGSAIIEVCDFERILPAAINRHVSEMEEETDSEPFDHGPSAITQGKLNSPSLAEPV